MSDGMRPAQKRMGVRKREERCHKAHRGVIPRKLSPTPSPGLCKLQVASKRKGAIYMGAEGSTALWCQPWLLGALFNAARVTVQHRMDGVY